MPIKLKVGVDPEFFTADKKNKRYCSAHDLVPGNKDKPHPLEGGAVQADGCAIEFNIDPAESSIEFKQNTTKVMEQIRKLVPDDYEFVFKPIIRFDEYYFDTHVPAEPKELGCNPDFNAYSKAINPRPEPKGHLRTARTAAGHFHIGWTKDADVNDPSHRYDCELVVRALEATIGPYMKLWDKDKERSAIYGKPGAFRYKPYGVEWRTPSNVWLNHPEIWEWLYDAITYTVQKLEEGAFYPSELQGRQSSSQPVKYYNRQQIATRITGGSAAKETVEKYVNSFLPGFPPMPSLSTGDTVETADLDLDLVVNPPVYGGDAQLRYIVNGGAHDHRIAPAYLNYNGDVVYG